MIIPSLTSSRLLVRFLQRIELPIGAEPRACPSGPNPLYFSVVSLCGYPYAFMLDVVLLQITFKYGQLVNVMLSASAQNVANTLKPFICLFFMMEASQQFPAV